MPDANKLRELVLYVAGKSVTDENFGLTKLNKILFAAEFLAYKKFGSPITGEVYVKKDFGPVPESLNSAVRDLKDLGDCVTVEREYHGFTQKRLVALRDPALEWFSAAEIALVDEIIWQMWDSTGKDVSEWSHLFIGWQAADFGEAIPYGTAFLGEPRPLTEEEIGYAQDIVRHHRETTADRH